MIIVIPNKCAIFAELNEANHNKDYSVVKTFKVGRKLRLFCICPLLFCI